MTADIHEEDGLGHRAGRDGVERFLLDHEIRKLSRDLRILIACNGTLTRTLGIVADDEIVVQIVEQQLHGVAPSMPGLEQLPSGRVLQRRILLKGRSSGHPYVAAESLIAVDVLPPAIMKSLTNTEHPIGEIMAASCLESFKEAAEVWRGQPPGWLARAHYQNTQQRIVGRRYRVIAGGQPVIVINEYFLQNIFLNVA
jgi:chorismate-pyruvate lyase